MDTPRRSSLALACLLAVACGRDAPVTTTRVDAASRFAEGLPQAYKALPPDAKKRHDPVALLTMRPGLSWSFDWPEHPDGRIHRATNARGFNEDEETPLEKHGLRVLVAGDSHTEGVVSNDESFPNVLERLLRTDGYTAAEVINAGVGYTGPRGYLGMLRKHLDLAPDVFIATLFTGNDFWNDLLVAYLEGLPDRPHPDEAYYAPLREAEAVWAAPCWQGVNQAYRFAHYPEEQARALDAVEASFVAMQALCAEHDIRFLVVVLPTKYDVDLTDQRAEFAQLAEHLGLTAEDMATNARLADELVRRLGERDIDCLDATPAFRAEEAPLYWRRDHHLNLRGHAKLAELLRARIAGVLPPAR